MKKSGVLLAALIALSPFSLFAEETLLDLLGTQRINADGEQIRVERTPADSQKITAVYFSAHWCPPCQLFTPELVDTYTLAEQKGFDLEIVFVSFDQSEEEMMAYMKEAEMPWLALPYESETTERVKTFKSETLGSGSIPLLVILDSEGAVITQDGRTDVEDLGLQALIKWGADASAASARSLTAGNGRITREKKSVEAALPQELPAPEKDSLTLRDLLANRFGLEGKIIETDVTLITSFEQRSSGQYSAYCHYHQGGACSSEPVYFPTEAREFCDELTKKAYSSSPTELYIYVSKGGRLRAVGSRYRKSKNEYSW